MLADDLAGIKQTSEPEKCAPNALARAKSLALVIMRAKQCFHVISQVNKKEAKPQKRIQNAVADLNSLSDEEFFAKYGQLDAKKGSDAPPKQPRTQSGRSQFDQTKQTQIRPAQGQTLDQAKQNMPALTNQQFEQSGQKQKINLGNAGADADQGLSARGSGDGMAASGTLSLGRPDGRFACMRCVYVAGCMLVWRYL
jgi:hypothetical protein